MQYLAIFLLITGELLFILYNTFTKNRFIKENVLGIILTNILITIDLGINFIISLTTYSDGISVHGFFSQILILEEKWSIQLFKEYYNLLSIYTFFTIILYFIISLKQSLKNN